MSKWNRNLSRVMALATVLCVALLLIAAPSISAEQRGRQGRAAELRQQMQELEAELAALQGDEIFGPRDCEGVLPSAWVDTLNWRSIGPASMSGRIIAFSVVEDNPGTFWVATCGGGLLKTTSNGAVFEHQFTHEGSAAIGDVCHAPSNPDIVWVGTGEQNPIRSGTYGDGVYKSTDGGATWTHMGLHRSFQIGRIAIHPTNPDIVYVAAQGKLWGTCENRGVYKTTDGGRNWEKVLYLNEKAAFVDLKMDPKNPNVLYAAAYERVRDEYDGGAIPDNGGPESGIYKTTDGGDNWTRLEGGLPNGSMSRIGISIYPKDPNIVYANIEVVGQGARERQGVYKSTDAGETWTWKNSLIGGPAYFYSKIYVDPNNSEKIFVLGVSTSYSMDSGETFTGRLGGMHSDHHAMWIDPANSNHFLVGTDGGFYQTYDNGQTMDFLNQNAIGTFYDVNYDLRPMYRVYGGLQDNGSHGGPSRTRGGRGPQNSDWFSVGGGDGFVCLAAPDNPDIVYSESQNGSMSRRNLATGESARISPPRDPEFPNRFNWKTPMILSPHDPKIFFCAGTYVFKSTERGDNLKRISPKLTRTDRGAATALAQSPVDANVIYVGCEDGELWVTTDGGENWENLTGTLDFETPHWVSSIEASRFSSGRAYVAFDAHRNNSEEPLVFVTEDFGQTWKNISNNLPWGTSRTIREDPHNRNLLYVGAEFGVYVSLDRGDSWTKINNNLPTVSVRELRIQPVANDLIAATHGRSIWILDVAPLQQMSRAAVRAAATLYKPSNVIMFRPGQAGGRSRTFTGQNPPGGAQIYYSLSRDADEANLQIVDLSGNELTSMTVSTEAGFHRVAWNFRPQFTEPEPEAGQTDQDIQGRQGRQRQQGQRGVRGQRGGQGGQRQRGALGQRGAQRQRGAQGMRQRGGRGRGGFGAGPAVGPGVYRVILTVDGRELAKEFLLLAENAGK